jgi:hypothetical protein
VSTLVLGIDDPAEAFVNYADSRLEKNIKESIPTPVARFPQAPGGTAVICLGGDINIAMPENTKPVGGEASLVLGTDDPADAFQPVRERTAAAFTATPHAAPRFSQGPGGTSVLCLGEDVMLEVSSSDRADRQAPGGTSTLVLGGDSNDPFDTHCERVSSNKFANASSQNSGNVITDRSSTRLRQAPGGTSTIILGGDSNDPFDTHCHRVSSNSFANSSNQNCGNVLTERPSTRLHQAPGGNSSIQFGEGENAPPISVSSNKFASGTNQNSGNAITDKPSTKVCQAPGGSSSFSLGASEAN